MKILVIGATGFIGPHVVSHLLSARHEVAIVHRGKTAPPENWDVAEFLGERANLQESGARAWSPDVVVDMILSSAKQAQITVNAFAGIAKRVVAISSGDVYRAMAVLHRQDDGPLEATPLTEDSPLRKQTNPYPAEQLNAWRAKFPWLDEEYDKIEVERVIGAHPELPATILRLPMVYGPGDRMHRLHGVLHRLRGRTEIVQEYWSSSWRPCRGYVENVAQAIALAAVSEQATGQVFNVADPISFTEAEWTAKIAALIGWKGRLLATQETELPEPRLAPTNFAQHVFMDSSRIRRELGYHESVPLDDAIRRTAEWELANAPKYEIRGR